MVSQFKGGSVWTGGMHRGRDSITITDSRSWLEGMDGHSMTGLTTNDNYHHRNFKSKGGLMCEEGPDSPSVWFTV